jgi:cytidine deaminase
MCAQAIAHARLDRLHFGASDPKSGGVLHGARIFTHRQTHHVPDIHDGIDAEACAALLKEFFAQRR